MPDVLTWPPPVGDRLDDRGRLGPIRLRDDGGRLSRGGGGGGRAEQVVLGVFGQGATFRQVGGAVAIAVFGSLIAGSPAFLPGARAGLAIAAILLLIIATVSLQVTGRRTGPRTAR